MLLCFTCGKRPRRSPDDSMCRICRNNYVRQWKARKRYGDDLKGYVPLSERRKKKVVRAPNMKELEQHLAAERKRQVQEAMGK